jgi:hypothetical protein
MRLAMRIALSAVVALVAVFAWLTLVSSRTPSPSICIVNGKRYSGGAVILTAEGRSLCDNGRLVPLEDPPQAPQR